MVPQLWELQGANLAEPCVPCLPGTTTPKHTSPCPHVPMSSCPRVLGTGPSCQRRSLDSTCLNTVLRKSRCPSSLPCGCLLLSLDTSPFSWFLPRKFAHRAWPLPSTSVFSDGEKPQWLVLLDFPSSPGGTPRGSGVFVPSDPGTPRQQLLPKDVKSFLDALFYFSSQNVFAPRIGNFRTFAVFAVSAVVLPDLFEPRAHSSRTRLGARASRRKGLWT